MSRIGIAGAGLLGRLLAWQLAERGHSVSLFETGTLSQPAAAGWTAAGMIAPLSELADLPLSAGETGAVSIGAPGSSLTPASVLQAGRLALEEWPRWLTRLSRQTGLDIPWRQTGSVIVSHPADRACLHAFQQRLERHLAACADPAPFTLTALDAPALRTHEPALASRFHEALWLQPEATLDPRALFPALALACHTLGVSVHEHTPIQHCQPGELVLGDRRLPFDLVLDTRGLGARSRWPDLRGVRGEVMLIESPEVPLVGPVRLMHPRYRLYVVPRDKGRLLIGATEIESEDYSPISLRSSLELSGALFSLHPALGEARILETASNCRPALLDNSPHWHREPGLIAINGLYRHGYLFTPALVLNVLAWMTEESLLWPAHPGTRQPPTEIRHA